MTRLRHTNLVNALFYLPRPAVVLVPLLLKGLTLIVTLGVTAGRRSRPGQGLIHISEPTLH